MSGIIARFETEEPVFFREKGCNAEFAARISGALYINDYEEDAYGANGDDRRRNLAKWAINKVSDCLSHWAEREEGLYISGSSILESLLGNDMNAEGLMGSARIDTM